MSQLLRSIPASLSEEDALYGLDPLSLAQLALKDANKTVEMQPKWARTRLHQVGTSSPAAELAALAMRFTISVQQLP